MFMCDCAIVNCSDATRVESTDDWVGYLLQKPLAARQGTVFNYNSTNTQLMSEIVSKVPDAQVMADLDGALRWAEANGGNVRKAGITGFCWGGRITWLYAAHAPIQAGVAWYGRLVGTASPLTPKHPVDIAASLKAPVLGLYGGADTGIPLDTVDKMKAALANGSPAARASQFVVYPDAPHAFHADYRPSYRKEAAEDGWKRALAGLLLAAQPLFVQRLRVAPFLDGEKGIRTELGLKRAESLGIDCSAILDAAVLRDANLLAARENLASPGLQAGSAGNPSTPPPPPTRAHRPSRPPRTARRHPRCCSP